LDIYGLKDTAKYLKKMNKLMHHDYMIEKRSQSFSQINLDKINDDDEDPVFWDQYLL